MNITAETWSTVSKLLDEALDLAPAARADWLQRIAARDPAVAPTLERLLAAHASSETADVLRTLPSMAVPAEPTAAGALRAGDRVGPYRLKRELGTGGMAVVWLAERADGAFTRDVALKLPQISRLRRDLAERFARERDILAKLEHPHIARLYDAGVSDDGLPYLALEYVEGAPITTYCDQHKLDVRARLQLFAQVLDAVQYAHAHLVIHRDLKPSNVLVTSDGQVRLLDFGIAKLLADDEHETQTQLTQMVGRALTPDYASPEQIKGEPLTIATDIYSLGVVLYELLTGSRPYRLKLASAAQLEQAIVEADPTRPSNAVEAEPAAQARGATRSKLTKTLAGDLDTIVLKALQKAPAQRYGTAPEFADDLQRYCEGRAVHARPDSLWYRTRKGLARHKLTASAAATTLVAVIAGSAVALWQANVARQQAHVAQREALRAQTVQRFLLDIFKSNSDQQADPLKARATTARELLDIGARRAAEDLKDAPEVQDEVLGTLADMYVQMKLDERAVELRRQRVDALKRAHGARDPRVADALITLATDLSGTNQRAELPQLLDEAERILDAAGDQTSETRGALLIERANYFRYVSFARMRQYADQALALFRSRPPDQRGSLLHALRLAALARLFSGDAPAAEPFFRELVDLSQQRFPNAPAWQITPLVHLAETQARLARVEDAEGNFRRAWELSKRINGEFNADALQTQAKLGGYLHSTGRRAEGRAMLFAALHALGREKGNDAPNTVGTINFYLGTALTADGHFNDAQKFLAAEADDLRQHYPQSQPLARVMVAQADLFTALGRYREARALLDESDAIAKAVTLDVPGYAGNLARFTRARLLLAQEHADEALAVLEAVAIPPFGPSAALPIDEVVKNLLQAGAHAALGQTETAAAESRAALETVQRSPVHRYFAGFESEASLLLGQALRRQGELAASRLSLERALTLREAFDDSRSPWLAQAQIELAKCHADLHQRQPAQRLLAEARSILAGQIELGRQFREPLRDLQKRLGSPSG